MTAERRRSGWTTYTAAEPIWSRLFVGMALICWLLAVIDVTAWRNPLPDTIIAVLVTTLIWLHIDLTVTRDELRRSRIGGKAKAAPLGLPVIVVNGIVATSAGQNAAALDRARERYEGVIGPELQYPRTRNAHPPSDRG